MSINNTIIYVALLIVPLLPLESTAEGVELSQSFYSPKFALQTEKTALCNKVFWLDEEAEQESNKISKRPKAGLGIYTAEFLAATVDGAVGLIVGSCGALGCFSCIVVASESLDESGLAYLGLFAMVAGAAVGAPMGAAYGVTYKGKQLEQGGSF
ncbi:MAG TPA: hypothetical protein EYP60_00410 [bacterium (Candidatus Stahlbacteria)]|nr:hypothetical protein [Candidatus Stahlbacteria bacterium]